MTLRAFRARVALAIVLALVSFVAIKGCSSKPTPPPPAPVGAPPPTAQTTGVSNEPSPIKFVNVANQAGINFKLGHGGKSPLTVLETTGGGAAFLDYDGDGWPDIFLVGPHNARLYHNLRNGKFKDVTAASGIDPTKYWMGVAVGDYDGDGKPDVFLTGYKCFALYHNEGGGRFKDVTVASGITGLDWSLSGVFADLDGDGKIDLYVSQYVKFDKTTNQLCVVGTTTSACGPEQYVALSGKLFRNIGGGKFQSMPWNDHGKTWGALASDLLGQGYPSLYLANDMVQGDLWSRQNGQWKNLAQTSGTGFDAEGHVQGGMGVDSADYDNDGKLDLLVTTYFAQAKALYHNDGNGLFSEKSNDTHLGPPTMKYVGFGATFADFDCDGWQDLVIANGHVRDNIPIVDPGQTYAQPVQAFRNLKGVFSEVSNGAGLANVRAVGRGLSIADYDHDGRPDVLVVDLEGNAILLHNVSEHGHWLEVNLRQPGPNPVGIGAMLTLECGGTKQIREIRTCGSVMSSQMPMAHFGLGKNSGPCKLMVKWPGRKTRVLTVPKVDQVLTITPSGLQAR